jgi:hypothetical protein
MTIVTVLFLSISTGCSPTDGVKKTTKSNDKAEFLTVDFNDTQTLRYKFVSARNITIDWEPSKTSAEQVRAAMGKSSESLEIVVAYTPIEINPYGLSTIEATCESVKVRRSDDTKQDAVENFAGKTYRFKVGPTGKIEDYTELDKLIKEIGEKAFRPDTSRGRIKEPDMIADFIASQWFLWDSVSSIQNPAEGVRLGQSWQSQLSVPTPMIMRKARDVTYRLEEIRDSEKGRLAVISSSYSAAETAPQSWPVPYTGRFQMSGKFGFLGNYQVLELQGSGEELFNVTLGRTEQYTQHYEMQLQASIPLGIGESPKITIIQNLTMNLLED